MEQQSNLKKESINTQKKIKETNNPKAIKIEDANNKDTKFNEIKKQNENNWQNKKEDTNKHSDLNKDNNSNIIYVGSKPLVNYVRGVIMQFIKKDSPEVIIKSRGRFISKAVDVAEVAKRSLSNKNIRVKSINISSESFETEGKRTNISTMDIVLGK